MENKIPCEICNELIDSNSFIYYAHVYVCNIKHQIKENQPDLLKKKFLNKYKPIPVIEKTECFICFNNCKYIKIFPCLHEFCSQCCDQWADHCIKNKLNIVCPTCKKEI